MALHKLIKGLTMFEIENKILDIASCTLLDNEDSNYLSSGEAVDEIWKYILDIDYLYKGELQEILAQDVEKVSDDDCLDELLEFVNLIKEEPW
jgi:hypothetical protein